MKHRLPVFAAALWWGSLSAIGFMAVPMLFANLPQASMAGFMAAKLFAAQTWVSLACGLVLLVLAKDKASNTIEPWARAALGFVLAGMLMALVVQYGISPKIVQRENLKFWHGLGTLLYALQWLCAALVLWRASAPASRP
ncbi:MULTISPECIES: DUF4149 domain-containing protein [unclassified Comamonas]|jgi:hypothetical protein|uniref:DUF4149 domain-containing protein n=1 Tax=Comamonas squillarum TaxID=2977320 RepID=A0ABY6A4E6_9BURK|nr:MULTISPECIES: DUF4149 domain-containing protein [unclassified Comamonas]PWB21134.1 DUF4149 domain-containing protein [Comamonas sp. JNW]UXC19815.1 DUF4149 domain-containing protein [Comamonas sp. PR12]